MSRTVRRLPVGRHYTLKWYRRRFDESAMLLLRHPPRLRDQNTGRWVEKWGRMVYAPSTWNWQTRWQDRLYSYWEERGHYKPVPRRYYKADCDWDPDSKKMIIVYRPDISAEYKSWQWEECDYDEDEEELYEDWLEVHTYVHRNGTCRRQRQHAVRNEKRSAARQERARQKVIAMRALNEYLVGDSE